MREIIQQRLAYLLSGVCEGEGPCQPTPHYHARAQLLQEVEPGVGAPGGKFNGSWMIGK